MSSDAKEDLVCQGCSVNHRELIVIMEDPDQCLSFLFDHLLLRRKHTCPSCDSSLSLNIEDCNYSCFSITERIIGEKKQKIQCRFVRSGFKGTFFENSHLTAKQVLDLVYFWLAPGRSVGSIALEIKTPKKVVTDWFALCRDVATHYCNLNKKRIGGKEASVEIDEAVFGKKKSKHEGLSGNKLVLGGLERGTKNLFITTLDNTDKDTTVDTLKKWIYPGSQIITDSMSSLRGIEIDGYTHKKVRFLDHPSRYLDPESDEEDGSEVEKSIQFAKDPSLRRIRKKQLIGNLGETLFKKVFKSQEERFHNFLLTAAEFSLLVKEPKLSP